MVSVNTSSEPDTAPGPYYVSAIDRNKRVALCAGPFATHPEALALVDEAMRLCGKLGLDPFHDVSYGTVRMTDGVPRGPGRLNDLLGVEVSA